MAITLPGGFNITNNEPADARYTVADESARLGFSAANVYEGLVVYQQDTDKLYVLTDTANADSNSGWTEIGGAADLNTSSSILQANIDEVSESLNREIHSSSVDSGSFATRIDTLETFSSSLETSIYTFSGSFSGSFEGDGSNLTNITATAISVDGILSSSIQIGSDISGSFTLTSSSLAERITTATASIEANSSSLAAVSTSLDVLVNKTLVSSSIQIGSDISGSFTLVSESLAERITEATASISNNSSSIAQLLNFSASLNNDFATDAELNASSSTLQTNIDNASSSLATSITQATASISDLVAKSLVSSSTFTTSTQGTFTASINGNLTILDLGLEPTDSPTFTRVTADDFVGDLNGAVRFEAFNNTGGDLLEGRAVKVTGLQGNTPTIGYANASASAGMPAFGLVRTDISNGATGEVITFGDLRGINTSAFNLGDTLYIGTGSAGVLTNNPPTGSALIQNIGKVTRLHGSNGTIKVGGAGRSAATPNLETGKIFYGVGDRSIATDFSTVMAENGVEFSDILNKPTLVSQSNQIASDISGSFTSVSSSITDRLDNIEFVTEGKDITSGSTIITNNTQGQVAVTHNLNSSSFKTVTGLGEADNPTFATISASNDIYVANNLVVANTASIAYLQATTTNTVNVGDSKILLNIDTPTVRFGGMQIIDSGSLNETASLLWDGHLHDFIYDYGTIGGDHEAGVFLAGPEMASQTQTTNRYPVDTEIQMGTGTHHLTGSKFYIKNGHLSGSSFSGSFFGDGTNITNINASSLPGGLLSSSIQIGSDISGSFTKASQSLASRIDVFEDATVLSSSLQIASEISGSFSSDSASFARRATWATESIERNETAIATLNSSGILSSSIQIGSDISGSFTSTSASIAVDITDKDTRLNTLEGKTLVSQSNQIASDISGSFTSTSASIAESITQATASISANSSSIADLLNFSASLNDAFATDAELNASSSTLQTNIDNASASLAADITTNATDITNNSASLATSITTNATNITSTSASLAADITTNDSRLDTLESKTLVSSSNQIASDISGSFTSTSASIATRFDNLNTNSFNWSGSFSGSFEGDGSGLTGVTAAGTISSSNQIASEISGSFTSLSSSFEARITANSGSDWTNITNVPQDIVSSSIQLASDISGSFTSDSASLASRISLGMVTASSAANVLTFTKENGDTFQVSIAQSGSIESASYAVQATSASFADWNGLNNKPANIVSSSLQLASDISGSFTSTSASIATDITANSASAAALATATSSYAVTNATNHFTANQVITGSLTVTETLTVQTLVNEVTQSFILYSSGSTKFGDSNDDNHAFTGSIEVVGGTISGSHIGDGSGLTGLTADSVTWTNITSKPANIVSSSIQLASDISGSFTSDSSSLASRIDVFEDATLLSSSIQIASDISGSFTAVSNSFENRVTDNRNSIDYINNFTSSLVTTASNHFNDNQVVTGSVEVTTNIFLNNQSSSLSFAENANTDQTSEVVATVDTNTYNAAWFDYYLYSASNHRAGTVMAVTDGTSYEWNDVSTLDVGDTTQAQTNVILNGTDLEFKLTTTTTKWTIKTIVRTL